MPTIYQGQTFYSIEESIEIGKKRNRELADEIPMALFTVPN